jgi:hypothetical protein
MAGSAGIEPATYLKQVGNKLAVNHQSAIAPIAGIQFHMEPNSASIVAQEWAKYSKYKATRITAREAEFGTRVF